MAGTRTLEHVLNQDTALRYFLVNDELLVVRSHKKNHGVQGVGESGDGGWTMVV